jgi:uncharacterized protein
MSVKSDSNKRRAWLRALLLPGWVFVSFITANILVVLGLLLLQWTFNYNPTASDPVFNTVLAAVIYSVTLAITLGLPWLIRRHATSRKELGIQRLPTWIDIVLAPAGAVVYLILSDILVTLFAVLFPQIDLQQAQDVGFENLSGYYQYLLAFVTLVIVAPLAEEALFRGYLYGKLRKSVPLWVSVLITSMLFGAAHGQWNVAVDTFALSVVLCSLREVTGSIWAGTLLHMLKNGLAFYLLFINPSLLTTIGG